MTHVNIQTVIAVLICFGVLQTGNCLRCYECAARLGPGESSECLTGDGTQLRRVHCIGPSVCATYHYQAKVPGAPRINHITRGCQALRYGATCEDIFHDLKSRGEVLPGQHYCATCSSDLCNSSNNLKLLSLVSFLVLTFIARIF